jgi:hypothetical protein
MKSYVFMMDGNLDLVINAKTQDNALDLLELVSDGPDTKWAVVYELDGDSCFELDRYVRPQEPAELAQSAVRYV